MKDLKNPAKSLFQNELNLEHEIIASEEDYHMSLLFSKSYILKKNFE